MLLRKTPGIHASEQNAWYSCFWVIHMVFMLLSKTHGIHASEKNTWYSCFWEKHIVFMLLSKTHGNHASEQNTWYSCFWVILLLSSTQFSRFLAKQTTYSCFWTKQTVNCVFQWPQITRFIERTDRLMKKFFRARTLQIASAAQLLTGAASYNVWFEFVHGACCKSSCCFSRSFS